MRVVDKTIKLAEIRRLIRRICKRYNALTELKYPFCFTKPQKEIEKTAIKIYDIVERKK